jgi:peptidoglycan hydrolase FlgJ
MSQGSVLPLLSPASGHPASGIAGIGKGVAPASSAKERAAAVAKDFEAVFLNSMFQEMFTGIDGDGPFGGGAGSGVWRSFLSEEYAKSFAKSGGLGIGSEVYATLLKLQEANGR